MNLDNRPIAPYFPPAYYLAMVGKSFRDRVLRAFKEQEASKGLNKAELSRMSGVPYHTVDKYLKREGATTSAENAKALADALGIKMDGEEEYDELRSMFFRLPKEKREYILASMRGLLSD